MEENRNNTNRPRTSTTSSSLGKSQATGQTKMTTSAKRVEQARREQAQRTTSSNQKTTTQARTSSQTRTTGQVRTNSQTRTTGQIGTSSQARTVGQTRTSSQVRTSTQARGSITSQPISSARMSSSVKNASGGQTKIVASSKRVEEARRAEQVRRSEQTRETTSSQRTNSTGRTTQSQMYEPIKPLDEREQKKPSSKKQNIKFIFKIGTLLFLITILLSGIVFYMTTGQELIVWKENAQLLVHNSNAETFRQTETSVVYDTYGNQIATLKGAKDVYYIEYSDIPSYATEAMISMEDKKFETHNGIDMRGIIRAMKSYIDNKGNIKQGASTITQQLSRNIFLTHERSFERKIKEIFIALALEEKYTKSQIMEFYLNNIYFGNGYYGIQAASKGYFNREVSTLSLGEIAFLCAIPNNPTLYDPIDNYDNTIKRKNRILEQMYEDGKLTLDEKNNAVYGDIQLEITKTKRQNYVETYIYYCATRALMESRGFVFRYQFENDTDKANYEDTYNEMYRDCQQSLYSAGYRIYTSINLDIQEKLQNKVDSALSGFTEKSENGIFALQGAATTIDNDTGKVVAIVGGRSQETTGYTLNRAYQSYRQPGSSIKPILVYTPAFERGYTPSTIVVDEQFEGGPRNSGGRYAGKITVRTAVEKSTNTVAWKLFQELKPSVGLGYLLNMNFAKIDKNDYYPAASLGGFTNGVTTVEMASAFATLENDGDYRVPTCIVKIMDTNGTTIVKESTNSRTIYNVNATRMMTDVLKGVFTNGTGKGLGLRNMPAAGKTGTTNDKKDGWFVGYTPYYTTSVWVGYDLPKSLNSLSGASYPGKIWNAFMQELHEGLEYREFPKYDNSQEERIKAEQQKKEEEDLTMEEDIIDDEEVLLEEENDEELDELLEDDEENMELETEEETLEDVQQDNTNQENSNNNEQSNEEVEEEVDEPVEEEEEPVIEDELPEQDFSQDFEEDTSVDNEIQNNTQQENNNVTEDVENNVEENLGGNSSSSESQENIGENSGSSESQENIGGNSSSSESQENIGENSSSSEPNENLELQE